VSPTITKPSTSQIKLFNTPFFLGTIAHLLFSGKSTSKLTLKNRPVWGDQEDEET